MPTEIDVAKAILELIDRYGVTLVALIFVIIAWVGTVKWAKGWFDKILSNYFDLKTRIPDVKKESVETLVLLNSKIREVLLSIQIDLESDWVQLWQFHNGTHGIGKTRIPFMFLTMTHEVCRDGCDAMRGTFSQLPLSMFTDFANDIVTKDILVHTWEDGKKAPGMGRMMHDFGASIGFIRAIRDEDGHVIGLLVAAWKTTPDPIGRRRSIFLNGSQRITAVLASEGDQNGKESNK